MSLFKKKHESFGESPEEELANSLSHGIGALLSIVALVVMIIFAAPKSAWHVIGVSLFGISLVLLYLASMVFHWVSSERLKRFFRFLDHSFIFILIAGSYMPWLLVTLRGPLGWTLFALLWGLAIAGIVMKAVFLPRFEKLSTALYLAMGWMMVLAIGPLVEKTGWLELSWLVAGGLFYTIGVIFFLMKRKFAHFVWHLFVLGGSACHVTAVFFGVILK